MPVLVLHRFLLNIMGILPSLNQVGGNKIVIFDIFKLSMVFFCHIFLMIVPIALFVWSYSMSLFDVMTAATSLIGFITSFCVLFSLKIKRNVFLKIIDQIELLIVKSEFSQFGEFRLLIWRYYFAVHSQNHFVKVEAAIDIYSKRFIFLHLIGEYFVIMVGTLIFSLNNWLSAIDPCEWDLPLKAKWASNGISARTIPFIALLLYFRFPFSQSTPLGYFVDFLLLGIGLACGIFVFTVSSTLCISLFTYADAFFCEWKKLLDEMDSISIDFFTKRDVRNHMSALVLHHSEILG